jgi:hypothetical protein
MGLIIFIIILITLTNIFITRQLTDLLKDTRLDTRFFYRLALIPPIGAIVYCLSIIVIIVSFLIVTVMDIWHK